MYPSYLLLSSHFSDFQNILNCRCYANDKSAVKRGNNFIIVLNACLYCLNYSRVLLCFPQCLIQKIIIAEHFVMYFPRLVIITLSHVRKWAFCHMIELFVIFTSGKPRSRSRKSKDSRPTRTSLSWQSKTNMNL